jgi:hypothetical protein
MSSSSSSSSSLSPGTRVAFPNQLVTFTVQVFVAGQPVTAALSDATLTIGGGSPLTCTIQGMDLLVTVPNDQSLGLTTFDWQWTQVVDGVTSTQTASYPVTIIAQPSGSSQSYVPANVSRQCVRLVQPDDGTVEQINGAGNALAIYVSMPYILLRAYAANFQGTGPDLLSISYVDPLGQSGTYSINCTLWMSDNAYILISADNGTQFAIASVNANFWQNNAQAINARNTAASFPALMPCSNASRYDYPALLANRQIPSLFIYDGVVLSSGTSSSPTVV